MPTFYCTQTTFSFANKVASPAQIGVFLIDGTTGVSISLYETYDYTVNWKDKTITVVNPIILGNRIRIDVYEIGNGDQLVKSNTEINPLRVDDMTGFNEIFLDCNYSGTIFSGSGVIVTGTEPVNVTVTSTDSVDDTLLCDRVDQFLLNGPITFTGTTFGNITAGVTYYVKTISLASFRITVSLSSSGGLAGPALVLTTASGSMEITIQTGSADVYTPPIVYVNGTKLNRGALLNVSSTLASTNSVTCNTTAELVLNSPIIFSNTIFGGVILPLITYYIKGIVDSNKFTISTTPGGAVIALTNSSGGAAAVVNDYAFDVSGEYISAKMVFAAQYDASDYISYAVFGQTEPVQYGYTIPEVQIITGSTATVHALTNYVGGDNPTNAIVEKNGIRLTSSAYSINSTTNNLTLTVAPLVGDKIAVTSYNLTERQYLNTQYGVTSKTVSKITYVDNTMTAPLAVTNVTATTSTSTIICDTTTNFVVDQPVIFQIGSSGTFFGGINAAAPYAYTVYYIKTIIGLTSFNVSLTQGGAIWTGITTGTGLMVATVGGTPAVQIQTATAHGLATNDIVRIDGISGSVQLNNNTFYARKINSTTFDIYSAPYDPVYTATNLPITDVFTYVSGGYAWIDRIFTLLTTTATATTSGTNKITCVSTLNCVVDTPVIFTAVGSVAGDVIMGGLVVGTTYYIIDVTNALNQIVVSANYQGTAFAVTTDTGSIGVTQWEQVNVDRLWVTINGHRVPSSSLRINPDNNLSILVAIVPADEIIITNMIPTSTPNELTYIQNVTKNDIGSVYRANQQTRTWLTEPLYNTDSIIQVQDITKITDIVIQNEVTPTLVDGIYSIFLKVDKRIISQVIVFNVTTGLYIDPANYSVVVSHISPMLHITAGTLQGQLLIITTLEGNTISINGEQISFTTANLATNTLSGLQRGANGTGQQTLIPMWTEVYSVLSKNKLPDALYQKTFAESDFPDQDGDVDGGPLQFFDTPAAIFLQRDIR